MRSEGESTRPLIFLGVKFGATPEKLSSMSVAELLQIDTRRWAVHGATEVFTARARFRGGSTPITRVEQTRIAERLIRLCALLGTVTGVRYSIGAWLAEHPVEAQEIKGPLALFSWATGKETDFDLSSSAQRDVKSRLWEDIKAWNGLLAADCNRPGSNGGLTLVDRIAVEHWLVDRKRGQDVAERRKLKQARRAAEERLHEAYAVVTDELSKLPDDHQSWVQIVLRQADRSGPSLEVELLSPAASTVRLIASVREQGGAFRLSLRTEPNRRASGEKLFDTEAQLSDEILARLSRHIVRQLRARPQE